MGMVAGKYAIVTGGATGIGFGVARRLLEEGAQVLIAGNIEEDLTRAAVQLQDLVPGAAVRHQLCNVTIEEQVAAAVQAACDDKGELDIMVANAGSGFPDSIQDADTAGWRAMMDLNIIAVLSCIKHSAGKMKNKGGSIVTMSTVVAAHQSLFMGSYSSSKAGQEALAKSAANELAPFNIRVNSIRPGYIPGPSLQAFSEDSRQKMLEMTALGRPGTPEEIGDGVLYFCSDLGKWVTGQVLGIDGGMALVDGADYSGIVEMMHGKQQVNHWLNK
ncbi:MAG: SDR family NAD(P)-dependent oxidoreductase [Pseudomonadales bacterium]